MITTYKPPGKPATVAATDVARAARLLAEAEQIARALPLDEQAMAPEDLCVPRISSMALTSRVAIPAV
jgi:hypothetical protein